MSRLRGDMALKRKQPEKDSQSKLTPNEDAIHKLIKSKGNMGIWKGDIKKELNISAPKVLDNCIKSLRAKGLIKEVPNIQAKGKIRFMCKEFEPSTELTGGTWYSEGKLDVELIELVRKMSLRLIKKNKAETVEGILDEINRLNIVKNVVLTAQHIKEVLQTLVLDKEIMEMKSTGTGEYASIPVGTVCYRPFSKGRDGPTVLASIPCGACPRIGDCTPDGIISPITCVYYTKWLDF